MGIQRVYNHRKKALIAPFRNGWILSVFDGSYYLWGFKY